MAMWNGKKIVYFPPTDLGNGWEEMDCGCCNGIEWGGCCPTECWTCKGSGHYYRHIKSGALALYPGGPFCGREPKVEIETGAKCRV